MASRPAGKAERAAGSEAAIPDPDAARLERFCEEVWRMGAAHSRDYLPWRFLDDPYAVCVSEVMLQQTQVKRVLKHWPRFMALFPTVDALASASASDVLVQWQGLGYNRRALALKRTADICSERYEGNMPRGFDELLALPGIGPATAAGITAFAYRKPCVYLETNVRSVFIREFFPDCERVADRAIAPLVERCCPADRPREWYYALLDYGAYLKSSGDNPSRRSAAYSRQSAFEGSHRQRRSLLLREVLSAGSLDAEEARACLNAHETAAGRPEIGPAELDGLADELVAEGFFKRDGAILHL